VILGCTHITPSLSVSFCVSLSLAIYGHWINGLPNPTGPHLNLIMCKDLFPNKATSTGVTRIKTWTYLLGTQIEP
jgi:hypothetical protein